MALLLMVVILLILGAIVLYYCVRQKRSLSETLHLAWNYFVCNKVFVILLTCCYLFVYVAARILTVPVGASAEIYLNYDGASNGLNPNGTPYNSAEIISDEVLELAIQEGDLEGFTAESLGNCLKLEPVNSDSPVLSVPSGNESETLSSENVESTYSVQTGYRLVYDPTETDLDIPAETVLSAVTGAYNDYFTDSYLDKYPLLKISDEELAELDDLDYLDILNFFETKTSELQRYMIEYQTKNGSYQSSESGETFYSLYNKIDQFMNIDLERFEAYLLDNGVSKDSDRYINKLNYENKMMDIDYQKDWTIYETNLDAVDLYHREMARIVLVPTEDDNEEFYMSRTRIGVDYLSEDAEDALKSATSTQQEIHTNEYAIGQLTNGSPTDAVFAKVDEMCAQIKEEIVSYAEQCNDLISEYLSEKESGYLVINIFSPNVTDILNIQLMIICTLIFLLLVNIVAMFSSLSRHQKRKIRHLTGK